MYVDFLTGRVRPLIKELKFAFDFGHHCDGWDHLLMRMLKESKDLFSLEAIHAIVSYIVARCVIVVWFFFSYRPCWFTKIESRLWPFPRSLYFCLYSGTTPRTDLRAWLDIAVWWGRCELQFIGIFIVSIFLGLSLTCCRKRYAFWVFNSSNLGFMYLIMKRYAVEADQGLIFLQIIEVHTEWPQGDILSVINSSLFSLRRLRLSICSDISRHSIGARRTSSTWRGFLAWRTWLWITIKPSSSWHPGRSTFYFKACSVCSLWKSLTFHHLLR